MSISNFLEYNLLLAARTHQHYKTSTLTESISKSTGHLFSQISPNLRTVHYHWLPLANPVFQLVGVASMMPKLQAQVHEVL